MKLTIISRVKRYSYQTQRDEIFTDIEEIEIDRVRWETNHTFSYVKKGHCQYEYLEDNQEILRLTD